MVTRFSSWAFCFSFSLCVDLDWERSTATWATLAFQGYLMKTVLNALRLVRFLRFDPFACHLDRLL